MDAWKGSFAQNQLEKFGWNKGEGLGKNKDGNVKHISVTKKNDKKGVGVGQDQWEFAWWDHLFNKSASGVVINKDDEKGEIKVETKNHNMRKSKTGIISTVKPSGKSDSESSSEATSVESTPVPEEKPRTMMDSVKAVHQTIAQRVASSKLYGAFVKSSTGALDPSAPTSEQTSQASSKNASDEGSDNEFKDYSMKVTDAELFAACEGRTARKGGRGLVEQKGKFARVMTEYLSNKDDDDNATAPTSLTDKSQKRKKSDDEDDTKAKKKKKSKREDDDKESKKSSKKSKKEKKEKKSKKDDAVEDKSKKEKKEKKEKKVKKVKDESAKTAKDDSEAKKGKKRSREESNEQKLKSKSKTKTKKSKKAKTE